MQKTLTLLSGLLLSGSLLAADSPTEAMPKIMVVDFELRDVSPIPNVAQEVERTALVDAVIRKSLSAKGYELVPACEKLQDASEQGLGYLYDRPEIAGKLGGECGADYVLMGQTWKPSFLFVFPQIQVVDTGKNLTRAELVVVSRAVQLEASTADKNVTEAAAAKLATQIADKLETVRN